jgi:hypothetical protein
MFVCILLGINFVQNFSFKFVRKLYIGTVEMEINKMDTWAKTEQSSRAVLPGPQPASRAEIW